MDVGDLVAVAGARLGVVDAVVVRDLTFALLAQSFVPVHGCCRPSADLLAEAYVFRVQGAGSVGQVRLDALSFVCSGRRLRPALYSPPSLVANRSRQGSCGEPSPQGGLGPFG